jgi:hypothetical protein
MPNRMTILVPVLCFTCLVGAIECRRVSAGERRAHIDRLIEQLKSVDWRQRMSAAASLGNAGLHARHALPALWNAQQDPHESVRRWAAKSTDKLYGSLKSNVPKEELVKEIESEPKPPTWNRIPAYVPAGWPRKMERGFKSPAGRDENQTPLFGGWFGLGIPGSKTARRSHIGYNFAAAVNLGDNTGLSVYFRNSYVPELWEEREILTAPELTGRFALLELPQLPKGCKWLLVYDDLRRGFDLDADGRADITLRVAPANYKPDDEAFTAHEKELLAEQIRVHSKFLETTIPADLDALETRIESVKAEAEQARNDSVKESNSARKLGLESQATRLQEQVRHLEKRLSTVQSQVNERVEFVDRLESQLRHSRKD